MSFLGPQDLELYLNESIINPYNKARIKQAAYELSLGDEVYRTDNKERKVEHLHSKNKMVEINPGQFTLLLTKETLTIPPDKLAFISIKAKQKLKGLVNVSGFHVDPGFHGKILFSVYNAGSSTITLETDKPYFLIWFSDLNTSATGDGVYNAKSNDHQGQNGIPSEYIDALKGGELASPSVLMEKIKELEHSLTRYTWAASIAITIATGVIVKLFYDYSSYKEGIEYGRKSHQFSETVDLAAAKYLTDSVSLYKIDSLINEKLKAENDTAK